VDRSISFSAARKLSHAAGQQVGGVVWEIRQQQGERLIDAVVGGEPCGGAAADRAGRLGVVGGLREHFAKNRVNAVAQAGFGFVGAEEEVGLQRLLQQRFAGTDFPAGGCRQQLGGEKRQRRRFDEEGAHLRREPVEHFRLQVFDEQPAGDPAVGAAFDFVALTFRKRSEPAGTDECEELLVADAQIAFVQGDGCATQQQAAELQRGLGS